MRGLLASPCGFLIGLSLGAVGAGGSIVAVPALVYVAGQDPSAATTTSLLVVGVAALVGLVGHARAGRVRFGPGILIGVSGIGGSIGGSALNTSIDGDVLLLGFGGLVLVAAWRMVSGCPSCTRVGESRALAMQGDDSASRDAVRPTGRGGNGAGVDWWTAARVAAVGTMVGFLTGLFGVGGGFVVVPALTLLLGFSMPGAVGTSLLVVVINTVTALVIRLGTNGVEWSVAVPFTVAAVAGVVGGSRVASRIAAGSLVRWFAGLLVVLAVAMIVASVGSLAT